MSEQIQVEPTTQVPNVPSYTKGGPPSLTAYEWHKLLKILEYNMQICNRDTRMEIHLWERISTQLHGEECIMTGSEKDRRMFPQNFAKKEEPIQVEETKKKQTSSLWERIFGDKK